ncbi:hypothetical protein [Oceanobacillus luteolus]|uniref:Yip1 domain-containing protein n=1 Tax=Oceanobacillus luteolus TaxID=1274358 RepID=A0ABW4HSU3_9BACI
MRKKIILLLIVFSFISPLSSMAMVDLDRIEMGETMFQSEESLGDAANNLAMTIDENTYIWANIIPAIFTALFIYFLIRLAYALITKVGTTLKSATWGLITIPLIFIFFRIVGIFILGENDIINVDGYLNSIISFLSSAILFVALGMILIGLLFRMFNKLISHPAYSRWSNRLFLYSGISIVLSIVVKPVLYNI